MTSSECSLADVLARCVVALAQTDGVWECGGSALYGLTNYIARYSLAATEYWVSDTAYDLLRETGLSEEPLLRSAIPKRSFTFEHLVPANVVRSLIARSDKSASAIQEILAKTAVVTILTKEEDVRLNKLYRSTMPEGWVFGKSDPWTRYSDADIRVNRRVEMKGALVR